MTDSADLIVGMPPRVRCSPSGLRSTLKPFSVISQTSQACKNLDTKARKSCDTVRSPLPLGLSNIGAAPTIDTELS